MYDFCNPDLIPIDQSKAVEELFNVFNKYQAEFDFNNLLDVTLNRLKTMRNTVEKIELSFSKQEVVALYKDDINEWIKNMSRGLVPINYVDKDEFGHDPALGQPPVPSIGNVIKKGSLEKFDHHVINTTLQRRINKINFKLRELNKLSANLLNLLEIESNE